MLTAVQRIWLGAFLAVGAVTGVADPAAGQWNPDDPCATDPTSVECQEWREENQSGGAEETGQDGPQWCGPHNGVRVPCQDGRLGFWVGTPNIVYGYYTGSDSTGLQGCWARPMGEPAPRPQPDWEFPIKGEDPGGPGRWFRLSCLGPDGVWPDGVVVDVAAAWLLTGDLPAGPDPEEIARRALAQIGLAAPEIRVFPPVTGVVPLGMPVWLTTVESEPAWGPISDEYCEQGLCVEITARAVRIDWRMGDRTTVSCTREQNVAWEPGMEFLSPDLVGACHHYYQQPSRDEPGGRYAVTATTTFRAEWAGGGESGVFTGVDDACGPGGDGPCESAVEVQVEEIQVLVDR